MVKVKATTIMETVIAMTIILILFLIAGSVLINISKSGLTEKKIKASAILDQYYDGLKITEAPFQNTELVDHFVITTEATEYVNKSGVILVRCSVSNESGEIIAEQKRILTVKSEQ